MRTFTLSYADDDLGERLTIDFEAIDAGGVFRIADRATPGRSALLSIDGAPACRLEKRPTGLGSCVWIVGPAS